MLFRGLNFLPVLVVANPTVAAIATTKTGRKFNPRNNILLLIHVLLNRPR
jgi:hypothetical protein